MGKSSFGNISVSDTVLIGGLVLVGYTLYKSGVFQVGSAIGSVATTTAGAVDSGINALTSATSNLGGNLGTDFLNLTQPGIAIGNQIGQALLHSVTNSNYSNSPGNTTNPNASTNPPSKGVIVPQQTTNLNTALLSQPAQASISILNSTAIGGGGYVSGPLQNASATGIAPVQASTTTHNSSPTTSTPTANATTNSTGASKSSANVFSNIGNTISSGVSTVLGWL